jgi:exopolyphosphatase/pppGpp-phosphohydrolase
MLNMHGIERRLVDFVGNDASPYAAIFDVGTRATRLLVAPLAVPRNEWQPQYFFNTRDISRIGGDVGRAQSNLEIDNSAALDRAARFIGTYHKFLTSRGLQPQHVHAVGTAVFRWLENRTQVLESIRERTDVMIRVLEDQEEAQMSLAGIQFTHDKRPGGPTIGKHDAIVLIDQGGGSTEVSYSTADGRTADLHSFDEFGTVALRHKFFWTGAEGQRVEPEMNRRRIVTQLEWITAFAQDVIEHWPGYATLGRRKLHIYGMGSAITNCFPGMNNFRVHNQRLALDRIHEMIAHYGDALDYSREQIMTLWRRYKAEEYLIDKDDKDNLENLLLGLYGLPVFVKLLEKFKANELRICGYGLRYAYYLWKYHFRVSD